MIRKRVSFEPEMKQLLEIMENLYSADIQTHAAHPDLLVTQDPHACLAHAAITNSNSAKEYLLGITSRLDLQEKLLLQFLIIRTGPEETRVACSADNHIMAGQECLTEINELVDKCAQSFEKKELLELPVGGLFILYTTNQNKLGFMELRQNPALYEGNKFVCQPGRYSQLIALGLRLFSEGLQALDSVAGPLNEVLGRLSSCKHHELFSCSFLQNLSSGVNRTWVRSQILPAPERAKREGLLDWWLHDGAAERADIRRLGNENLRNLDILDSNVRVLNKELTNLGDYLAEVDARALNESEAVALELMIHRARATIWQSLNTIWERSSLAVAQMERYLILLQQTLHETIRKKQDLQRNLLTGNICSQTPDGAQVCSVETPVIDYLVTDTEKSVINPFPYVKFSAAGHEFPLMTVTIPHCLADSKGYLFKKNREIFHEKNGQFYSHDLTFNKLCLENGIDMPECRDLMTSIDTASNSPEMLPGNRVAYLFVDDLIYLQPLFENEEVRQGQNYFPVPRYGILLIPRTEQFWVNSFETLIDPGTLLRLGNDSLNLEILRLGRQSQRNIDAQRADSNFINTNKLQPDWSSHLASLTEIVASNPAAKIISVTGAVLVAIGLIIVCSLCTCFCYRLEINRRQANITYQESTRQLREALKPVQTALLGTTGLTAETTAPSWWRRLLCCCTTRRWRGTFQVPPGQGREDLYASPLPRSLRPEKRSDHQPDEDSAPLGEHEPQDTTASARTDAAVDKEHPLSRNKRQ